MPKSAAAPPPTEILLRRKILLFPGKITVRPFSSGQNARSHLSGCHPRLAAAHFQIALVELVLLPVVLPLFDWGVAGCRTGAHFCCSAGFGREKWYFSFGGQSDAGDMIRLRREKGMKNLTVRRHIFFWCSKTIFPKSHGHRATSPRGKHSHPKWESMHHPIPDRVACGGHEELAKRIGVRAGDLLWISRILFWCRCLEGGFG